MNLGTKNLNNLTDKDFKLQNEAAESIINNRDIKSFEILVQKEDYIFDFIKEKIKRNLIRAVNKDNVLNLFCFLKIYSSEFEEFIINSFVNFSNDEILNKMLEIIKSGSNEEKTYAVNYFIKTDNLNVLNFVRKFVSSPFEFLKISSINYLKHFDIKDEYNNAVNILNSSDDEFEKFEAAEFLCLFGDKNAFDDIYKYFLNTPAKDAFSQNILLLKNFEELISNKEDDKVLNIYSTLLKNFPDSVLFSEISYYLSEGVFDFLIESDENYSVILNYILLDKINLILSDDAYKIDLDKNDIIEAEKYKDILDSLLSAFDKKEIILNAFGSLNKDEILFALNLIFFDDDIINSIINLADKTNDEEIILNSIYSLKKINALNNGFIDSILSKINNETIKAEIISLKD